MEASIAQLFQKKEEKKKHKIQYIPNVSLRIWPKTI